MIFTYLTVFLANLLVAMLAVYFYRLISRLSKSASKARKMQNRANHIRTDQKVQAWHGAVSRVTTNGLAQTSPAMPVNGRGQNDVWPYRKSKQSATGSAYKVKRTVAGKKKPAAKGDRKPWGW
ncbi:MAG: hypothetical protein KJO80_08675 [Gammaproteobacteria bacterium]|nr:hypothetical protein [Gammaproteobacteria bacterium]